MTFKWKAYPAGVKVIFGVYSIGFLAGTYNHLKSLWINGLLGADAPLFFSIYWDTLTLLDPIAVFLIWTKPRLGIGLAVLIMFTDIIINATGYVTGVFGEPIAGMIPMGLFLQSLFGTFVFVTAPVVLEKLQRKPSQMAGI